MKVDKDGPVPDYRPDLGPCWLWTGATNSDGYGHLWVDGRWPPAHRVAYEQLIGAIPDLLVLDHLCRVTQCVNPSHLEPVTNQVNILRGKRSRSFT